MTRFLNTDVNAALIAFYDFEKRASSTHTPVGGVSHSSNIVASGNSAWAYWTDNEQPHNNLDWPTDGYGASADVTTAGADITYGLRLERYAGDGGVQREHLDVLTGQSGTGIKSATAVTWGSAVNSADRAATDAFVGGYFATNANTMMSETLAFAASDADAWCECTNFTPPSGAQTVSPSAISSAEALGATSVSPGAVAVTAAGIATGEVFGTASVGQLLSPTGIVPAEALGTATLTVGAVTVSPAGVPAAETFGTAITVPGPVTVGPAGIGSTEAFGAPALTLPVTLSPTGITSAEVFGTPSVAPGAVTVGPSTIASAEAFGAALVSLEGGPQQVTPGAIASAEAVGVATLSVGAVTIAATGITSGEAFGAASLSHLVALAGIASAEALGALSVTLGPPTLIPASIGSAEVFGGPSITTGAVIIAPAGIVPGEAFGTAIMAVQALFAAGTAGATTARIPYATTKAQTGAAAGAVDPSGPSVVAAVPHIPTGGAP